MAFHFAYPQAISIGGERSPLWRTSCVFLVGRWYEKSHFLFSSGDIWAGHGRVWHHGCTHRAGAGRGNYHPCRWPYDFVLRFWRGAGRAYYCALFQPLFSQAYSAVSGHAVRDRQRHLHPLLLIFNAGGGQAGFRLSTRRVFWRWRDYPVEAGPSGKSHRRRRGHGFGYDRC